MCLIFGCLVGQTIVSLCRWFKVSKFENVSLSSIHIEMLSFCSLVSLTTSTKLNFKWKNRLYWVVSLSNRLLFSFRLISIWFGCLEFIYLSWRESHQTTFHTALYQQSKDLIFHLNMCQWSFLVLNIQVYHKMFTSSGYWS